MPNATAGHPRNVHDVRFDLAFEHSVVGQSLRVDQSAEHHANATHNAPHHYRFSSPGTCRQLIGPFAGRSRLIG